MSESSPYEAQRVPAPPDLRARMRAMADAQDISPARRLLGALSGVGLVLLIVFGAIAALDVIFGIIGRAEWIVLVLGSTILIVPMLLIHLRGLRETASGRGAAAATLRAAAEAGEALRHTLHRDTSHWFVEHEHGVIHVCPADARRTLYLDLSSISDDPRHDEWFATGRIDTATWTWFTTPDRAVLLGFEASGPPLAPNALKERTARHDAEAGADLFEFLGSPDDGDVIARPFAEVDAVLRQRIRAAATR